MVVDVCAMRLWLIYGVQLLRGPCPSPVHLYQ